MFYRKLFENIDNSECLFIAESNLTDSKPIETYKQYQEVKNSLKFYQSLLKNTIVENLSVQLAYMDSTEADKLILGSPIIDNPRFQNELENQPVEYLVQLLIRHEIIDDNYELIINKNNCILKHGNNEMSYEEILEEASYIIDEIYHSELKEAEKKINKTNRNA
jgi:hypothetical protein